jgi:hypothetical protein
VRSSSALLGGLPTRFDVDVAEREACSQFAELECCCSADPGTGSSEKDDLSLDGVFVHR